MAEKENLKIGILGGTFNPIHIGHLILAQNALNSFNLDKILIMPSGCSYLKDQRLIASKIDRINMTRLAIEDNADFELSTIETDKEGNTYTSETLSILKEQHPDNEYYFIIGADTLFTIETWKNPEVIFNKCTIIAAPRNTQNMGELENQINYLKRKYRCNIELLYAGNFDVSSTVIREMISQGKSVKYYLPDSVIDYINKNQLYV